MASRRGELDPITQTGYRKLSQSLGLVRQHGGQGYLFGLVDQTAFRAKELLLFCITRV